MVWDSGQDFDTDPDNNRSFDVADAGSYETVQTPAGIQKLMT